ncbi:MAG: ABC transporter permease, partial [Christensenellaceae bacterium]
MKREATYSSTIGNFLAKYAIFIVTIVLFIALSVMSSGFLTSQNLVNILRQQSFVGMIAVGMTFVIITGGIDLSVGAILAFSGMCTAIFCVTDANGATVLPLGVAVMIGIAVSVLIGCGNGLLVAKGKVAPFIATLGMQTILRGAALLLNDGRPVINLSNE